MKKKIIALVFCVVLVAALVAGITMKSIFDKKGRLSNEKITVEQYKGLEVETMDIEVSDEDVESSIKSTMDAMELGTKEEVKDRGAESGDTIVMDYTGKKDGTPFDKGSDTDFEGVLGSIGFIDGFESAIVGHKAGETFDIDVTFPKDYQNKELAGQPVVFTITDEAGGSGVKLDSVAVKLDGSPVSAGEVTHSAISNGYSFTYTPGKALDDGSHTVTVDAADNDGNAAAQKSTTFKVDTIPPTLNVTSPTEGMITSTKSLTVSGTTNDATSSPVTVKISLNSTDQGAVTVGGNGAFSKAVMLKEGENVIVVTVTDAAGKSSSVTRNVTLDTSVPKIVSSTITPNPVDAGQTMLISVEVSG